MREQTQPTPKRHPFRTAMSRGPVPEIERLENILIIEDDRAVQRVLRRLFRSAGYGVLTAGDGIAGLEVVRKVAPSAIVLDLGIPRKLGQEVCRELTRIPPATPILILIANSD